MATLSERAEREERYCPLGLRNWVQPVVRWAHVRRLELLASGKDVAPATLDLDPVDFCNHDCVWCLDAHHGSAAIPLELIEALSVELREFEVNGTRCEGIVLKGGGEPTLHPDFSRCIEMLSTTGCHIGVISNGSRLAQRTVCESIARHASFVRISLDAADPESHARTHKSRDFQKILEGIGQLVDLRREGMPVIGLTFVVQPDGADRVPGMIELAVSLAADYIQLRLPYTEEVGYRATFSVEQWLDLHRQMARLAEQCSSVPVFVSDYLPEQVAQAAQSCCELPFEHRARRCYAHRLTAVLTGDASVYGCCEHRNLHAFRFGRLEYPGSTLREIWASPQRAAALERMARADCLSHCTHPVSLYNEAVAEMQLAHGPCTSFV